MVPRLMAAEYRGGYRVRIEFLDGTNGEIDLERELWGEVFTPLRDPALFQRFRLDKELNTLVWPNGADFAPEFLHACVTGKAWQGTRI